MDGSDGVTAQQVFWQDQFTGFENSSGTPSLAPGQQLHLWSAQVPGGGPGPGQHLRPAQSSGQSSNGSPSAQGASPFPPFQSDFRFQYPPVQLHPPPQPAPPPAPSSTSPSSRWRDISFSPESPPSSPELEVHVSRVAASSSDKGKKRAAVEPLNQPSKKVKQGAKGGRGKGKGKAQQAQAQDEDGTAAVTGMVKASGRSGRAPGAQNYNDDDLRALFKILKKKKPMSQQGWQQCGVIFNRWAEKNGRPARAWKALRTKFEMLVNTPKPTGEAEVPWQVEEAWQINSSIEERVYLREVNDGQKVVLDSDSDSDGEDGDNGSEDGEDDDDGDGFAQNNDSDIEVLDAPPKPSKKSTVSSAPKQARAASASSKSTTATRRAQTAQFMSSIVNALDPAQRSSQDEARFARKLVQGELDALRQDKRELEACNRALEDRIFQLTMQLQQQGQELARLQARFDMQELLRPSHRRRSFYDDYSPRTPRNQHHSFSAISPRTPRFDHTPRARSPSPQTPTRSQHMPSAASALDALASLASSSSRV
ncbi:hypothetical protein K466DRAFT_570606 [Polyporus arcularius HHB13444]|uniref:DUF6818 domain-containing protein n=1 Tax=Polyporus arcularius HHB13444 TaxID=1314778 RepID=A0A5C3NQ18_9APHY|nr:hypothetical protein K466DRAFT_570606 [Polyporus arcularius HHB13444]